MAHYKRAIPLTGRLLSIADFRTLYQRLTAIVATERERELASFTRPPNMSEEQFHAELELWRVNAYRVTVTIAGEDGSSLYEDNEGIFTSPNLPQAISYIFMTNMTAYETVARRKPINNFILNMDLQKLALLDNNHPLSNPTPNFSNLTIEGSETAWLATIEDRVMDVMDNRKHKRSFLHGAFRYDAGLMLFAVPVGLYACWKLSGFIDKHLGSTHTILAASAYIYLFFLAVWAYRVLFGYTKWAFPTVELLEATSTSKKHRTAWYWLMTAIGGSLAYDVLKWMFV